MKNKGNILIIVLICFLNTLTLLSSVSSSMVHDKQIAMHCKDMMHLKNIEIITLYHLEKLYNEEGILLSESYEFEDLLIEIAVNANASNYDISIETVYKDIEYSYEVKLDFETKKLYDFQYN